MAGRKSGEFVSANKSMYTDKKTRRKMIMNILSELQHHIDKMNFYQRYLVGFALQVTFIACVIAAGLIGEWLG
jgi:hypothetical protein